MFLDMDQHICFWGKPYLWDNPNLEHIRVDSLSKGRHDIRQYKCRFRRCIVRLVHMAMGSKDQWVLDLWLEAVQGCNL